MAKSFAKSFYNSKEWKQCRKRYIELMPKYKRGLCEKCYVRGEHVLGEELHHKIWLTAKNINDSRITLNHDNLILLCYECHKREHGMRNDRRYQYDDDGNIIIKK